MKGNGCPFLLHFVTSTPKSSYFPYHTPHSLQLTPIEFFHTKCNFLLSTLVEERRTAYLTLLFNQQSAILSPFSIPTSALVMMAAAFTVALDSYGEERGAFSGEYIFDHNEAFLKKKPGYFPGQKRPLPKLEICFA